MTDLPGYDNWKTTPPDEGDEIELESGDGTEWFEGLNDADQNELQTDFVNDNYELFDAWLLKNKEQKIIDSKGN